VWTRESFPTRLRARRTPGTSPSTDDCRFRTPPDDARRRLIEDGELVWVYGPRRHELATAVYDETLPKGGVVVRDIAGLAVTEIVRLVKMDVEHRPVLTTNLA
jgi:anaerobic selenocysteine-containing dehydrogenase